MLFEPGKWREVYPYTSLGRFLPCPSCDEFRLEVKTLCEGECSREGEWDDEGNFFPFPWSWSDVSVHLACDNCGRNVFVVGTFRTEEHEDYNQSSDEMHSWEQRICILST